MKYELLGSVRVHDGTEWLSVSARKIETLLATLLIRADHVVTIDQLITEIWDADPPRRATAAIHVYVSQLRKLLRHDASAPSAVVTTSSGYMLRLLAADELDFHSFRALVHQGREHSRAGRHEDAIKALDAALQLWRGPSLGELTNGPIISGFIGWLEEIHLECIELMISACLALDRHREVVGTLQLLIVEHPLHEAFYHQLMLALFRSGRRADALQVYRDARETLTGELGLEPSRALMELQQGVLLTDPGSLPIPTQSSARVGMLSRRDAS